MTFFFHFQFLPLSPFHYTGASLSALKGGLSGCFCRGRLLSRAVSVAKARKLCKEPKKL